MKFRPCAIPGVFQVELEPIRDERGLFARLWSDEEFRQQGIETNWVQANIGSSLRRGTVRGLHYQKSPHQEAKLVWCPRGALYDVAVDLRPDSPTRYQWLGVELTADNLALLYVPPGCAHGYQTLADGTDLFYLTSRPYERSAAFGARWDDPILSIDWPLPVSVISDQDRTWPLLQEIEA